MTNSEKLCLQWNDFKQNISASFGGLRRDNEFTDVTLACEDGQQIETHKVILAASSPFFSELLRKTKHPHPLVYMRALKSEDLMAIIDFLYCGETNVYQDNLDSFLDIAEELQLKGLMGRNHIDKGEINEIPKLGKIPKNEFQIPKFSEPCQARNDEEMAASVREYDPSVGTLALANDISGDFQELDNKTTSMMTKTSIKNARGKPLYKCTLCGKEAPHTNLKNHIEANHMEGISIPCNLCEKSFRSRNALAIHKHSYHKHNLSQEN